MLLKTDNKAIENEQTKLSYAEDSICSSFPFLPNFCSLVCMQDLFTAHGHKKFYPMICFSFKTYFPFNSFPNDPQVLS